MAMLNNQMVQPLYKLNYPPPVSVLLFFQWWTPPCFSATKSPVFYDLLLMPTSNCMLKLYVFVLFWCKCSDKHSCFETWAESAAPPPFEFLLSRLSHFHQKTFQAICSSRWNIKLRLQERVSFATGWHVCNVGFRWNPSKPQAAVHVNFSLQM